MVEEANKKKMAELQDKRKEKASSGRRKKKI